MSVRVEKNQGEGCRRCEKKRCRWGGGVLPGLRPAVQGLRSQLEAAPLSLHPLAGLDGGGARTKSLPGMPWPVGPGHFARTDWCSPIGHLRYVSSETHLRAYLRLLVGTA